MSSSVYSQLPDTTDIQFAKAVSELQSQVQPYFASLISINPSRTPVVMYLKFLAEKLSLSDCAT